MPSMIKNLNFLKNGYFGPKWSFWSKLIILVIFGHFRSYSDLKPHKISFCERKSNFSPIFQKMVFLTKMVILVKFIIFDHFWSILGLKTPKNPLKPSEILINPHKITVFLVKTHVLTKMVQKMTKMVGSHMVTGCNRLQISFSTTY